MYLLEREREREGELIYIWRICQKKLALIVLAAAAVSLYHLIYKINTRLLKLQHRIGS